MDLSIIICTWNNSRRLAHTLESMLQCSIPERLYWEIVIVNNNCTDNTDIVVEEFANRLPIKYVREPKQGLSRAKNKGLQEARGELIIFTDDDIEPCAEWIEVYWKSYKEKTNNYFFGGPIESEFGTSKLDYELLSLAPASVKGLDWGEDARVLKKDEYFVSGNWACVAKDLKIVGGYNVNKGLGASSSKLVIGEESDVMNKLKERGLEPLYLPKAKVSHFVPKEKVKIRHIASRSEAYGYQEAESDFEKLSGPFIAGIPRWTYKKIVLLWAKWLLSIFKGDKGYREYLALKQVKGYMLGLRDQFYFRKQNRQMHFDN